MSPTSSERVLIVEDEPSTRVGLTELVRTWGITADAAGDGEEALQRVTIFRPSIIISDLVMPRRDGLELLRALKDDGGDYTVVILTAQGTVETAVEAMKEGAYDYLTKPIEPQRLKILLDKIVERQDTLREVKVLRKQLREHGTYGKMIGSSPQMRKVYQIIEQAAPTSASVLISGESGTGKELVAQTIHQLSPRAQMPFVPINCAAIPETLLESEIFGHEKGSFTGAIDRRAGCFELADHGTLFLDEIAEMTPSTQVKLLRVLQERKFRRLGGRNEETVDVRVIAATNVNPADAVRNGGVRYSSPQSPGIGVSADRASSISRRSSSESVKSNTRRVSSMCWRSPSRAPMITAPTAGCSSTQRVATAAIDTPCRSATRAAAARTVWYRAQPPAARMKRPYFICDQVPVRSQSGSACPSQRSLNHPPASVP